MAAIELNELPDVQATVDKRGVALEAAGVAGVSLPVQIAMSDGSVQASVAQAELTVSVPAAVKGTHMSRFIEEVSGLGAITPGTVYRLAAMLCRRLDSPASDVSLVFPLFAERPAPVTGASAPHVYEVRLAASIGEAGPSVTVAVRAAVTSLCPCSREISDYGAHSQRGTVDVEVESPDWIVGEGIWPEELFRYADEAGSAPIYPLLKRPDERFVTMQAYDSPAFVEDIARNVAVAVRADERCAAWRVSVANEESIHLHQAIARASGRR